ncbi:MAG: hypothetical protein RPT13_08830 [SAR324 cluster bacterium]
MKSNKDVEQTNDELVNRQFFSLLTNKYQDQGKMKNKFNRQGNRFGSREKSKAKGGANSSKGTPTSKEIELATKAYLSEGGKIDRVALNHGNAEKEVFRANLEPDSRLGMGTLVDDSWDCWENKDYDSNPTGSGI